MSIEQKINPGDPIDAAQVDEIRATLAKVNFSVEAPLEMVDGDSGRLVRLSTRPGFWAMISGSSSPYSWSEIRTVSTGWTTCCMSGTGNAYEVNGVSGLGGTRAFLEPGFSGRDWRFQAIRSGTSGGGTGGGCHLYTITTLNSVTGDPFPGIPVSIIGTDGSTVVSGVTDGNGEYTASVTVSVLQALATTPPDAAGACSCPANFIRTPGTTTCTATYLICKAVSIAVVENGGSLTTQESGCGPCQDLTGNYVREGSQYTWVDYGISSADGNYSCGGPASRYAYACSQGDLWGGCTNTVSVCGETNTVTVVTYPKSSWNYNVAGICSNDRSLVIPKTLYLTIPGPALMMGGNAGQCLALSWSGGWDGNPCTYGEPDPAQNPGAVGISLNYSACLGASGAYGMCGPLTGDGCNFPQANFAKVPYGSAFAAIGLTRWNNAGDCGANCIYTAEWEGGCTGEAPKCGNITAISPLYCAGTCTGNQGQQIAVWGAQMPTPNEVYYNCGWTGNACFEGSWDGVGPVSMSAPTYPQDTTGQGFISFCGQVGGSATISETCGSYGPGTVTPGGTTSLSFHYTPRPSTTKRKSWTKS